MTNAMPDMDSGGSGEYLVRSLAIVTILYERGILEELFADGRLTEEEVHQRVEILRTMYPDFAIGRPPEGAPVDSEGGI